MRNILEQIGEIGVVPVIAINDGAKARALGEALLAGGLPCAEVTFRTAEGERAIEELAKALPQLLLGAGTVLSTEQVDRAVCAGAKFIVSPGFNPRVVDYCVKKGVVMAPGCCTPSEMEQAMERGLSVVKFFPAQQAGGLDFIRACAAPYPALRFMPTGGINAGNLAEYLACKKILACGGSWMVKPELIDGGEWGEIERLCAGAANIAKAARAKGPR